MQREYPTLMKYCWFAHEMSSSSGVNRSGKKGFFPTLKGFIQTYLFQIAFFVTVNDYESLDKSIKCGTHAFFKEWINSSKHSRHRVAHTY